MIFLKTRSCPFCGESISEEAILCKYCHNLLIDENGNDIEAQTAGEVEEVVEADEIEQNTDTADVETAAEPEDSEDGNDKTIVYSKEELKKAMEQAAAERIDSEEIVETAQKNLDEYEEEYDDSDEAVYTEDYDDETEVYTYDDEEEPEEEEIEGEGEIAGYDPKRTFLITAIITLGILIIIIAAVSVGYKLFGFADDSTSSATVAATTAATTTAPAETEPEEAVTEEYVPQVTDDTASENPEEIADSEQADPVVDSSTDSAVDSLTDSSTDSSADSATDSSDESTSDTSSLAPPAGSYYSWDEAMQIWSDYVDANNLTSYGYSYGTDGVEMVYSAADAAGNTSYYRVDLVTGAVSVVQ
jgi:hypothetical protein